MLCSTLVSHVAVGERGEEMAVATVRDMSKAEAVLFWLAVALGSMVLWFLVFSVVFWLVND